MPSRTALPLHVEFALFDFDGVISDTVPLYLEMDRHAIEHFGYMPTEDELLSFVGHPSEILAPRLLAEHGINVTVEQFREVWDAEHLIYGSPDLKPSPGLPELWEELSTRGVKIGVVSTTPCSSLVRALDHFQLLSRVSVIVGRELVRNHKPDPEPYRTALAYLAPEDPEAAERAIAVEDSGTGIRAARGAGLFTVQYLASTGTTRDAGESAGANAYAQSMSELARMIP